MKSFFTASNSNYFIIPLVLIGITYLSASYVLWHKKDKLSEIITKSIIIFLIIYLPLLDYWSYWKTSWFWPSDFFHESGSVLSNLDNSQFGYYPKTQIIFNILTLTSNFLFLFTSILFVKMINLKQKSRYSFLNWLPTINSFSLSYQIKKLVNPNWRNSMILILWLVFSFLHIYYRFIAGWLFFLGFDSITLIDNILFLQSPEHTDAIQDNITKYTYVTDIINIITPPLLYTSGFLTFLVVKSIKKYHYELSDLKISEIGKS